MGNIQNAPIVNDTTLDREETDDSLISSVHSDGILPDSDASEMNFDSVASSIADDSAYQEDIKGIEELPAEGIRSRRGRSSSPYPSALQETERLQGTAKFRKSVSFDKDVNFDQQRQTRPSKEHGLTV